MKNGEKIEIIEKWCAQCEEFEFRTARGVLLEACKHFNPVVNIRRV